MMKFKSPHTSGHSRSEQICQELISRIRSGLLPPGCRLPSVRELAVTANISLVTAQRVYQRLQQQGLLTTYRGKGSFVAAQRLPLASSRPASLPDTTWQHTFPDYLPQASFWAHSAVRLSGAILDLSTASMHHTLLPVELLQASIRHALTSYTAALGNYAPFQGDPQLLAALSQYLAEQGHRLQPEQLMITNGTQQGLDLVARTFLGPDDIIAIESPCFAAAIDVFRFSGAALQPIPLDGDGLRLDKLEEAAATRAIKAIYTVPTYQNPTNCIMPLSRRQELLAFANRHNCLIIEDDPHSELTPPASTGRLPPSLKSLDTAGRVIYLKGFSKFLFPGLRLGVLAADGIIYDRLLAAKSIADLGSPLWLQKALVYLFSSSALRRHIRRLNRLLWERSMLTAQLLGDHLPPGVSCPPLGGGMHAWLTLPPELAADTLLPAAHRHGIHFLPGSVFYASQPEANHLRLCWTNLAATELPHALHLLCNMLNEELAKPHGTR